MSRIKGIISPQGEVLLAKIADEKVKWKNPFMEGFDGKFFLITIRAIDNNLLERIPEDWQNPLEPIIEQALQGNWEEAAVLITDLLNNSIDLPFLDEDSERLLFGAVVSFVLGLIMAKVEDVRALK